MGVYPDLPFDQAGGHGGWRTRTQMVVVHATFNTASDENEAHYAEHRSDQVSAHFYNDDDSVIQALDTDVVAYGCFSEGNSRSVQFELTGLDWDRAGGAPGDVSDATMRRIAPLVARVCRQYGIPARKVGPAELRAGTKGICGHADVTMAWGQGDHMDPGPAFPWAQFISYVAGGDDVQPDERSMLYNADAAAWGAYSLQDIGIIDNNAPGGTPTLHANALKAKLAAMDAKLDALSGPAVLSQADRDAIVAGLAALVPTLQQIEDAAFRGAQRAEDS